MRGWATPGTSRGRTPAAAEPQGGGGGGGGGRDGQLRHAGGECRRRGARARYPSILSSLFVVVDFSRVTPLLSVLCLDLRCGASNSIKISSWWIVRQVLCALGSWARGGLP